jgi:hypothetical protein
VASTAWIVIAVVFVVGLLLLGISSAMLRSVREESGAQPRASWPRLVDESLNGADAQLRLDMVERLAIVGSDWSRGVLERAQAEETDPQVRSAIELALAR